MERSTAIVLAGGRSARMGRAKALLSFGGEALIARVVATLGTVTDEIVVVAAPEQDLPPLPATVIRDDVAFQGPMNGIRQGLGSTRSSLCFVASCDCAFLEPALVSHLLARAGDCDIVVPRWQGRLQPLHAVYRQSIAPLIDEAFAAGERRPVAVFDRARTSVVEEDEICRFDPDGWSFFNINTPGDYREALEHLVRKRPVTTCTVELFGVARLLAETPAVPLALPSGAQITDVFLALAERHPRLVGRVIARDGRTLADGYACNVNGAEFIRNTSTPVAPGDSILILGAEAGG